MCACVFFFLSTQKVIVFLAVFVVWFGALPSLMNCSLCSVSFLMFLTLIACEFYLVPCGLFCMGDFPVSLSNNIPFLHFPSSATGHSVDEGFLVTFTSSVLYSIFLQFS